MKEREDKEARRMDLEEHKNEAKQREDGVNKREERHGVRTPSCEASLDTKDQGSRPFESPGNTCSLLPLPHAHTHTLFRRRSIVFPSRPRRCDLGRREGKQD